MARGYAVFANGGYLVEPYLIERIVDANGTVVFAAGPQLACDDCVADEAAADEDAGPTEPVEPSFRPLQLARQDDLQVIEQEIVEQADIVAAPSPAPWVRAALQISLFGLYLMAGIRIRGQRCRP